MKNVNLTKSALELIGGKTILRVRNVNGVTQFRPTNRTCKNPLPGGEILVDIKSKGFYSQVQIDGDLAGGLEGGYKLEVAKRGWLTLVTDDSGKPSVKVAA